MAPPHPTPPDARPPSAPAPELPLPPTPSPSALPFPPASPGVSALDRARLRRGHEEGVAAYGDLGLSLEAYEAAGLRLAALRAQASVSREGPSPEGDALGISRHLANAALSDLYLALAADASLPRAWDVLSAVFRPRLEAVAAKRRIPRAEAESLVQDLLGDLAGPPPRARARTLLGTFDGSGSLFAWLTLVLLRRIAGGLRRRRPTLLGDGAEEAGGDVRDEVPRPADPAQAAEGAESVTRFSRALAEAWASLTSQERLALVAKHRDGLTQRRVGEVLGVGEARVSRVVASAVAKLAGAVRTLGGRGDADPALWRRLEEALALHWARTGAEPPPSSGGGVRGPLGAPPPLGPWDREP